MYGRMMTRIRIAIACLSTASPSRLFLLLCVIGIVLLLPILGVGLLCDDYQYWLRWQSDHLTAADIFAIQGGQNRPLTTALLVFTTGVFESAPWLLGVLRVVHHAANALLVGLVVRRTRAAKPVTGFVAAVAFLLWGSHAEVYWQSSLHDVLAASFVLLAVFVSTFEYSRRLAILLVVVAFAGYWSKESAWCLPLVCFAILASSKMPKRFWGALVAAGAFVPYILLRYLWLDGLWGHVVPVSVSTTFDLSVVANSVAKLIFRSAIPGWIKSQSLVPLIKPIIGVGVIAAVILVIAALLIPRIRTAIWKRRADPILLAIFSFGFSLIPVAKLSVSLQNTENARYLYLPTAFAVVFVVLVWQRLSELSPRIVNTALLSMLLFQAGSLHAFGWNWVQATRTMEKYRSAVEELVSEHPDVKRWLIACAPDNYRGAFSARNTTPNIVEATEPYRSRSATVLANKYVREKSESTGCDYATNGETNTLVLRTSRYHLSHPAFYDGKNPVEEERWTIDAAKLKGFRANELTIHFDKLADTERIAVFDGDKLQVVTGIALVAH
jgi:hypothetical protein